MNTYRLNFANHSQTVYSDYNFREMLDCVVEESVILLNEKYDDNLIIINMSKVENIIVEEDE